MVLELRARPPKGGAEREVEVHKPIHRAVRAENLNSWHVFAAAVPGRGSGAAHVAPLPPFPISGLASVMSLWTVIAIASCPTCSTCP